LAASSRVKIAGTARQRRQVKLFLPYDAADLAIGDRWNDD
jgi:hypothetical protein